MIVAATRRPDPASWLIGTAEIGLLCIRNLTALHRGSWEVLTPGVARWLPASIAGGLVLVGLGDEVDIGFLLLFVGHVVDGLFQRYASHRPAPTQQP